jgi:hypothetical protein
MRRRASGDGLLVPDSHLFTGVASRNWWKFLERILTLFCTVVNG